MKQTDYEFLLQKRKDYYSWEIKISGSDTQMIKTKIIEMNEWAKNEFPDTKGTKETKETK